MNYRQKKRQAERDMAMLAGFVSMVGVVVVVLAAVFKSLFGGW